MSEQMEQKTDTHTPEPWRVERGSSIYGRDFGNLIAECHSDPRYQENARRIVACVNYCAGMTTEELEMAVEKRRSGEPYGRKSLRLMREFVARGAHLDSQGRLVMPSGKVHKPDIQWNRDRVHIGIDGESCTVQVARVICFIAHGEPPDESFLADHIDGNTLNDHPSNLRWASRSENGRNTSESRAALALIESTKAES